TRAESSPLPSLTYFAKVPPTKHDVVSVAASKSALALSNVFRFILKPPQNRFFPIVSLTAAAVLLQPRSASPAPPTSRAGALTRLPAPHCAGSVGWTHAGGG